MPPASAHLLLVRHGQSTWNATHRWQGRADPPLSPLGEAQARQAAAVLAHDGLEAVVTSPLRRARQTAATLAAELGLDPPTVWEDLAERDVGDWTGLTRIEIEERWPGALDPPRSDPPGGESSADFRRRVGGALDRALGRFAGRRVLVVAHGGVIRAVEAASGVDRGPIPNLVAWWVRGAPGRPEGGERRILVDPGEGQAPTSAP